MSKRTYVKLGLFAVLAFAGVVAAAFGLGLRSVKPNTVTYHTYFDESVQGLERGARVNYRGVAIGTVAATEIAPDRRHVDVTLSIKVADIRRLGLSDSPRSRSGDHPQIITPPDLRAQLGSQGITGVKFVNIDFFDVKTNPIVPLPFTPAENTIPAASSLMKSLEDSLVRALDRFPEMLDATMKAIARIDVILEELQQKHVPEAIARALGNIDGAVIDLRAVVKTVDRAAIPEKTARTIEAMNAAITKLNTILDRVDGQGGLLASTMRAADAIGDLGQRVGDGTEQLDRTLRDLGEAARAVRDLADAIEQDPDMLLKGRASAEGSP